MPDEVLTLREVAAYLRVTERTTYRMAGNRQIPAFRVGGSWRYRLTEIEAWIKARAHDVRENEDGEGQ